MNSSPNTERTRLARELHDGLAQELASFGYQLDELIGDINLDFNNRSTLRELRFCLSSIVNQVRDEIYELRGNNLKSINQQIDDQLTSLLANSEISYLLKGEIQVNSAKKFELLRAIRELLINAKRHANCSKITIDLAPKTIVISDNGVGGIKSKLNSFGLSGVTERLKQIDADLQINSLPSGTKITITFNQ